MSGRVVRGVAIAAIVALHLVAPPAAGAASAAGAAANGPCPGTTGVTVVVDFRELGGGIVVRCAPGSPGSGFAALEQAGFAATPPLRTPGFVCRLDGKPSAATEACVGTPPTTAYWSYWRAPRGGSWSYSPNGALGPPAEVEGWSFSLDRAASDVPPPGISPPGRVVPTTAPPRVAPTSPPPPVAVAGASTTPPAATPGGPAAGAATTSPATALPTTTALADGSATTTADPATTDGAAAPTTSIAGIDERERVEVAAANSGDGTRADEGAGPGGALVAMVLVAALAAGALLRTRRRTDVGVDDVP